MLQKKQLVIIGGGIAGLAAAFRIQEEITAKGIPIECALLEGSVVLEEKSKPRGSMISWWKADPIPSSHRNRRRFNFVSGWGWKTD